jgi:DNA polymerase III subunit gamma/tau
MNPHAAAASYEPCNTCAACLSILQESANDVLEIDAASNRGIDDIRNLKELVAYPPSLLKYRVVIIDEVHMLTNEAFNALLKTLEEPRDTTVFILATTELHKVPLTIRSRCQLFSYTTASVDTIKQALSRAAVQENVSIEPAALTLLAQSAAGSYRDALMLLEQLGSRGTITVASVHEQLGVPARTVIAGIAQAIQAADTTSLTEVIAQASITKYDQCISSLTEFLYHKTVDTNPHHAARIVLVGTEGALLAKNAPLPELVLLSTCIRMMPQEQQITLPTIQEAHQPNVPVIELPEEVLEPKDIPPDIFGQWQQLVREIQAEHPMIGSVLSQSVLHATEDTTLFVHVRYAFHATKLDREPAKKILHDKIVALFGQGWMINYRTVPNLPRREPKRALSSQNAAAAVAIFTPSA